MHFVYFFALVLFFLTLLKFVLSGKLKVPTNWVVIVFALFIIAQAVSTFFSIDKFTSVFGYPSRLNGGLFSQFAYLVIFTTALINLDIGKAKKLLAAMVIGALAVSFWGIPGHFGRDPSCYVLSGKFTSSCWQKEFDPTLRIFSTLGQPNWLASYLVLVLPIAAGFMFISTRRNLKIFFLATAVILYTGLVMTTSRAGLLGLLIAFVIFISIFLLHCFKAAKQNILWLSLFVIGLVIITSFFGRFLFVRLGEAVTRNLQAETKNQKQETSNQPTIRSVQQPNIGGTESSIIRLIVWKGAIEAFKHKPIAGFGPETFAYSYYLFRPQKHNKTTEWNFFYNKAHNEFLNYLAGVGAAGTTLYVAFLFATLLTFYKLIKTSKEKTAILLSSGFSSIVGYQTTIFFGFSTVSSQLIFFLIIAAVLVSTNNQKLKTFNLTVASTKARSLISLFLLMLGIVSLTLPLRFYFADLFILKAKETTSDDISKALADYGYATSTFPFKNPFYLSDASYATAIYATSFEDKNTSNKFAKKSEELSEFANLLSPNNLIITRRVANAYFILSDVNDEYKEKALNFGNKLTQLTPTNPQSYYALAQIQAGVDKVEDARKTLQTALNLKSDYQEARELLDQLDSKTIQ